MVIAPASSQMLDGDADTTGRLIAAAGHDVTALTLATARRLQAGAAVPAHGP
jgi:hypothetical protein